MYKHRRWWRNGNGNYKNGSEKGSEDDGPADPYVHPGWGVWPRVMAIAARAGCTLRACPHNTLRTSLRSVFRCPSECGCRSRCGALAHATCVDSHSCLPCLLPLLHLCLCCNRLVDAENMCQLQRQLLPPGPGGRKPDPAQAVKLGALLGSGSFGRCAHIAGQLAWMRWPFGMDARAVWHGCAGCLAWMRGLFGMHARAVWHACAGCLACMRGLFGMHALGRLACMRL
jgi:hypothetical protein